MQTIKELTEHLYLHSGTYLLSKKDTAKIIGVSISSLDRLKEQGVGPKYKKTGNAKNSTVKYPIQAIAEYIINNNVNTL